MYIERNRLREQKYHPRVTQRVRVRPRPEARSRLSWHKGAGYVLLRDGTSHVGELHKGGHGGAGAQSELGSMSGQTDKAGTLGGVRETSPRSNRNHESN